MNRIQQIIAIFLLALFMFHAGGYLTLFNWQQNRIREEMKSQIHKGIPDEQLTILKIPMEIQQNPFVFKRIHNKEFRYKGRLYDIAREEQVGKTTWFYCVQDNQETELVSRLNDLKKKDGNNNPIEKNRTQVLKNMVLSPYNINQNEKELKSIFVTNLQTAYFFSLKLWTDEPNLPPPKV